MARMVIKCFPGPGFDGVFRGGRKWPASGTLIETHPGADDIESDADHPLRIGTKTFAILKADAGRISFVPEEDVEDVEKLKSDNAALKARVVELEDQLAAAGKGGKASKGKD